MIFMLGGSATARLQHTGIIFSYGVFPLALWLLEEALDRRSYRVGVLLRRRRRPDDHRARSGRVPLRPDAHRRRRPSGPAMRPGTLALPQGRGSASSAMMAALGGALLAVPAILTMQFLTTSNRPSFGYGVAAMGSLPPESLATILFGNVFGSLRWTYDYWGPDWHSLAEGTWTDRATNYLFAGTIPALLLLWHGIAGGRLFAREFRFFLIVGILALLYALGRYTPGFELRLRPPARREPLSPAGRRHLPGQHRPRLRGRLSRPSLRAGRVAAMERLWPEARALCAARCSRAALALAAIVSAVVFAARAGQVPTALREIGIGLLIAAAAIGVATKAGAHASWRTAARGGPRRLHGRGTDLAPCRVRAQRRAGRALRGLPAAPARAAAGASGSQEGACRAQRQGRAPADRDPRPRRRLAERLDGPRARGHDRLQPAAPGRLRACGRPRRECRRPEPAHLPRDLPRLQVPARQPARARISRPRPADRAPAAPFSAPDRTRSCSTAPARCGSIA